MKNNQKQSRPVENNKIRIKIVKNRHSNTKLNKINERLFGIQNSKNNKKGPKQLSRIKHNKKQLKIKQH